MADLLHDFFFVPFRLICDISPKQVGIVMKMILF